MESSDFITVQEYEYIKNNTNDLRSRYTVCKKFFFNKTSFKWNISKTVEQLECINIEIKEFLSVLKPLFKNFNDKYSRKGKTTREAYLRGLKHVSSKDKIVLNTNVDHHALIEDLYILHKKHFKSSRKKFINKLCDSIEFQKSNKTIEAMFYKESNYE